MIEIDGSYLEGGGSIIRTAIAFSALTGKPCKITNIRAKRINPGLRTQHIESINAVAELYNAKTKGVEIGSTVVEFHPNKLEKESIKITIPTAGSVGLLLQSIFIACVKTKGKIEIEIEGGATSGKWSAPLNYIKNVLIPILDKFGYKISIDIKKYGYYPKGGASVKVTIESSNIKPIRLTEKGKLLSIHGVSHSSLDLKVAKVAERQKEAAEKTFYEKLKIKPVIEIKYVNTICTGSAIDLYAKTEHSYLGSDSLGERGKKAELIGKEASTFLIEQLKSNAAIDEYLEDQLLPFMAISSIETCKESKISVPKLTNHTKTNIWVVEKFLPVKFVITGKIVSCKKI